MQDKKFRFSKLWPCLTTIIFVAVLFYCSTKDLEDTYDTTMYVAMVTASASVELTTIVYYMKNSWMEKVASIKAGTIKIASQERLHYNKEMLKFLKENNLTREDLDNVENDSPMDELDTSALDSLTNSVDNAMEEASAEPERIDV